MKKIFFNTLLLLIFTIIFALIINPQKYIGTCLDGLKLWAVAVLPSLLPFFFLTLLLSELNIGRVVIKGLSPLSKFLYNSNGYGAFVQFMSIISGYPVGAKLISELRKEGKITKDEATKFSTFCSTSGPMFVIGSVGSIMFKSREIGMIFFSSHILSAALNGIFFRKYGDNRHIAPLLEDKRNENILYDCAFNSAISCIIVGSYIAVFFVVSQILIDFKILLPLNYLLSLAFKDMQIAEGFSSGLLECTKGCNMLSLCDGILPLPLTCALISFGGLSVILQSITFLKEAHADIKIFILSKIIQMITSFILCLAMCLIFL